MSNLWLSNSTHRVFGWSSILEEWNDDFHLPAQVQRVVDNLYASYDKSKGHNPTLTQFLTYLNYEQEGIAWFLYYCVSLRSIYGKSLRIDFIRMLVDEIDNLDSQFPVFPNSPTETIRQFVEKHLTEDELADVQMMPPLVEHSVDPFMAEKLRQSYTTPVRTARDDFSYAQKFKRFSPVSPCASPARCPSLVRTSATRSEPQVNLSEKFASLKEKKYAIILHFIRKENDDDDVVKITQNAGAYDIHFRDDNSGMQSQMVGLTRDAVIDFLSVTFRLIALDEQPFESVQFMFPSIPTVLVSPDTLSSQTRELIYESVELTMDYWPTA